MRQLLMTSLLGAAAGLTGCASTSKFVAAASASTVRVDDVAADLARADVVALGELHQTPPVHQAHLALIRALHRERKDLVIAMEMFERDVQQELLQYLAGVIPESEFLAKARPWPHYERDYRPVIEFAKANGLWVLAANAPRPLASKASKEGVAAVAGDPNVARETTAPKDEYWTAFNDAMEGHGGMFGPGGMERFYAAQCLKDDTMAESITDYLQRFPADDRPLAVLICGKMHSDHGRGTVQRIKSRMPELVVRVVTAETVPDLDEAVLAADAGAGDYVVFATEVKREPRPAPALPKPAEPAVAAEPGEPAVAVPEPTENPEGMKPALGFMPGDYNGEVEGILVGPVTPGGGAAAAGIEQGDVIVAINGAPTPDIETYVEVLGTLIIGRNATVRVNREGAEVDLQVKVGSRSR